MDVDEYRRRGKEMVDYIADYLQNIRERRVYPSVAPGYLRNLVPDSAPVEPESWDVIFDDVERVIMPGVTHWQSPYMHAYFPALNSFPSLLGDMLADAINCLGFTWASSPACTELETVVMNWLGKMIGLPDEFLHTRVDSRGGGVIQTTASEATFVCLLAGRTEAIRRYREQYEDLEDAEINSRLVAYCSDQAHSSVEKAGLIGLVKMRYIESDDNLSLRGDRLREAIARDKEKGLIPFFLCATLGTTGACAFDNLQELGPICQEESMWLHVDAAYAGTAFICPEFRHWLNGVEHVDSLAFNPSKWMMVHFDCTAMWFAEQIKPLLGKSIGFPVVVLRTFRTKAYHSSRETAAVVAFISKEFSLFWHLPSKPGLRRSERVRNSGALHRTFNVEPLYLQHENSGLAIDYMHWQIPLSKRFRALKMWFVIRNYGIKGLQKHIREGVRLAQRFEALVLADSRFEIPALRHLGMVVFRLKGENVRTERLLKRLNSRGRLHCVPAALKGRYVIRFSVTSAKTTLNDVTRDWAEIRAVASEILSQEQPEIPKAPRTKVPLAETRVRNENFGTSLLLANSPMSPKIVNGSFAAIFDNGDKLLEEFANTLSRLRLEVKDSPAMRRRIKGILMTGKQFSLDSRMDLVHGIMAPLPLMKEDSVEGVDSESEIGTADASRTRSHSVEEDNNRNGVAITMGKKEVCHKCGHALSNNISSE